MRLRLSAKDEIKKGKKKGLPSPPRPVPRSVGFYQAVNVSFQARYVCEVLSSPLVQWDFFGDQWIDSPEK